MTPAERIYQILLRLYPRQHRQAYGRSMLQHARDLERAARGRGRRHVAALYLRLVGDGIANASKEHWEAMRTAGGMFRPVPWPAVLMAAIPGLWMALTRRYADVLGPALSILGVAYIVLLATVPPIMWWRTRRLPVWALVPLGMLAWLLVLRLALSLASAAAPLRIPGLMGAMLVFLDLILASVLFATMLRGRRLPRAALVVMGLMLLSGVLLAVQLNQTASWKGLRLPELLASAFFGPLEALMLVAAGLPAARQHNVLALLVVIGGYGLIFGDSDYLWGSAVRDWPGLPLYLASMIFLFFVLAPTGLLRAKTRLGRAVALFVPAVLFLAARIAVPAIVLGQSASIRSGDALISSNILLSLILGWILYSRIGDASYEAPPGVPLPSP